VRALGNPWYRPLVRGDRLRGQARRDAVKMLRRMGRENPAEMLHLYRFYCDHEPGRDGRTKLSRLHEHPEVVEYRFKGD